MAKAAPPGGMLVITLTRSAIGTPYRHRLVLRGLGLRKLHQTVTHRDNQQVRGMIHKVGYLLKVDSR